MLLFLSLARFSVAWFQIDGVTVGSWPIVSPRKYFLESPLIVEIRVPAGGAESAECSVLKE